MLDDHAAMPGQDQSPWWRSASIWLMVGLAICFTAQQVIVVHLGKPYNAYLALSGYGMRSGHLWELFTYQIFCLGWVHFILTMAGFWWVGRAAEASLGTKRFLLIYFGTVVAGGIVQGVAAVAVNWLPLSQEALAGPLRERFGGDVDGASVGLCGVLAALCRRDPQRRFRLFSIVSVTGVHVFWIAIGIAVILVLVPSNPFLPHLAHLGALLTGAALGKGGKRVPSA